MPSNTLPPARNYTQDWPETPGVIVADGAAVKITVRDGHLCIDDGIAGSRRERKFSRVDRELNRLLILTPSGYITLDAISWLAKREIPWCQYVQSSGLQAISAPTIEDSRLLRAQAYAPATDTGLKVTRYLLGQKLQGQVANLTKFLSSPDTSLKVTHWHDSLMSADNIALTLIYESRAASDYWKAWQKKPVIVPFTKSDIPRVPHHWLSFSDRFTKARVNTRNHAATDPINAMLNYLYAIGTVECIHACHAVGLSPVLGITHTDVQGRNSFAYDLLECIRPVCDRLILEILGTGERIDRRWLVENQEGVCRLTPPLTHRLASYSTELASALTPHTAHIARLIANNADGIVATSKPRRDNATARLRRGVTLADVIPDECWRQIRDILPEPALGTRPAQGSERDLCAALVVKYVLKCPWSQVDRTLHRTAARRLIAWQATGAWGQVQSITEKHGHLDSLVMS